MATSREVGVPIVTLLTFTLVPKPITRGGGLRHGVGPTIRVVIDSPISHHRQLRRVKISEKIAREVEVLMFNDESIGTRVKLRNISMLIEATRYDLNVF